MINDKTPPHSLEVEQSILGSMIQYPSCLVDVFNLVSKKSFYKPENQIIFECIKRLYDNNKEIDILTITESLNAKSELNMVGGVPALMKLSTNITRPEAIEEHCFILKEKQISREHINFGHELIERGFNDSNDIFDTNEFMLDRVNQIQNIGQIDIEETNEQLSIQVCEDIEKAAIKQGVTGVPTGFKTQDNLFGGWQSPDLIILAARPAMGKTAKMLCDVYNMVVGYKKTVMVFSFEMSSKQLFKRMASLATGVDANKFKDGSMSDSDWDQFHSGIDSIVTDRLIIVDCTSGWTISDIRLRVKKEKAKRNVDCIYVDYLQLIEVSNKKLSREQQISTISRKLKQLCGEMKCPIIALSQLSRALENRTDKKPRLSDLRESGAIEQDADIVTFLHRPNYYGEAEPGEEDVSWLVVAKHRNGELMDIKLKYIPQRTQFVDYDQFNYF